MSDTKTPLTQKEWDELINLRNDLFRMAHELDMPIKFCQLLLAQRLILEKIHRAHDSSVPAVGLCSNKGFDDQWPETSLEAWEATK